MTVKQLIEELKKEDPNWNVYIPMMGKDLHNVVTKVEKDIGYYEDLVVLKTDK